MILLQACKSYVATEKVYAHLCFAEVMQDSVCAAAARFADYLRIAVHDDGEEDVDHREAHEKEKYVLVNRSSNWVNLPHLFPQAGVADGHVEQRVKCIGYRFELGHFEAKHDAAHDRETQKGYHKGDREMN